MKHEFFAAIYTFSLFLGMLLLLEIGRQIGIRRRARDPKETGDGVGDFASGGLRHGRFRGPELVAYAVYRGVMALVDLRESMK